MTVDHLNVYLNGRHAGALRHGAGDNLTFIYETAYRSDKRATPLSCALPLAAAAHPDASARPYVWGLLPDNERVLDRWARQFQVSARRPLDLLAAVGRDLPGAVEMLAPGDAPTAEPGAVEWLSEDDVASELRRVRQDEAAWLPAGGVGRWSLAGSHPKVALVFSEGRYGRPSGTTPTNRILKPSLAEFPEHDLNEHLCLAAATASGLSAAPSSIQHFGNERAVVVTRFDRQAHADHTVTRVHQEDLCQALAVMPWQKYESDGGPTAARIAALLRAQIGPERAEAAVWSFFDTLVFNWIIGAPDAHAKNYSLLHRDEAVRLAPLYDLGSALPYPEYYPPKIKLAMRVGKHYRVGAIGSATWTREAVALRLDADRAVERARAVVERVPDAFSDEVEKSDLRIEEAGFAVRLVDAVAHNAAFCQRRLR